MQQLWLEDEKSALEKQKGPGQPTAWKMIASPDEADSHPNMETDNECSQNKAFSGGRS
jgi:hypothetical protein